jgi:hypothetical protein
MCYKLISWSQWDNTVIFLISASSLKLVYDTYYINTDDASDVRY